MNNTHEKIEKNVGLMAVLIAVAVSFGGLAEIVPLMYQAEAIKPAPQFQGQVDSSFVRGIATVGERMLIVLDIESLLSGSEMGLVQAAAMV